MALGDISTQYEATSNNGVTSMSRYSAVIASENKTEKQLYMYDLRATGGATRITQDLEYGVGEMETMTQVEYDKGTRMIGNALTTENVYCGRSIKGVQCCEAIAGVEARTTHLDLATTQTGTMLEYQFDVQADGNRFLSSGKADMYAYEHRKADNITEAETLVTANARYNLTGQFTQVCDLPAGAVITVPKKEWGACMPIKPIKEFVW